MKRLMPLLVIAVLWFSISCSGISGKMDKGPPPLAVSRVVLYQNGVGYFERRGMVAEDSFIINVRHDQINDILKSLAVIDLSEGRAINVSLPVEKRAVDRLADLPEQVRTAAGLLDVLQVFRGAMVTVRGGRTISGRVLGVEQLSSGDSSSYRATFMQSDGTLAVVPIEEIEELTIQDRTLEVGLGKSLNISLDQGHWKPVALTIRLTEAAKHNILISYISEMPRWKPSYRVVVGQDRQVLLQGWAVVDNVSGEDWKNVRLSLVTGTPLSFRYDLHSPRFVRRVDLTPRDEVYAAAPTMEGAGYAEAPSERSAPPRSKRSESRKRRKIQIDDNKSFMIMGAAEEKESYYDADESVNFMDLQDEVQAKVEGEGIGSLFRYDVSGPVTVRDNSSTMVAIVNAKIPGESVWLFRPEEGGAAEIKPYRAIRLSNESGYTLEKGPVALYDQGTFVGEGFIDRQEKGSTTFITYARDDKITLSFSQQERQEAVSLLKIANGYVHAETMTIRSAKYSLKNRHQEAGVAVVRRSKQRGWSLRKPPEGTIETPSAYYIPVAVGSEGKAELKVDFTTPRRRRLAIDTGLSTTVLKLYLGSGEVPEEIRGQIEEILKIKSKLASLSAERMLLSRQKEDHENDQYRLRKNIDLLRKTRGNRDLVKELTGKLAKLERKLGKISGKLVKIDEQVAGLRTRLDILIRDISLDNTK